MFRALRKYWLKTFRPNYLRRLQREQDRSDAIASVKKSLFELSSKRGPSEDYTPDFLPTMTVQIVIAPPIGYPLHMSRVLEIEGVRPGCQFYLPGIKEVLRTIRRIQTDIARDIPPHKRTLPIQFAPVDENIVRRHMSSWFIQNTEHENTVRAADIAVDYFYRHAEHYKVDLEYAAAILTGYLRLQEPGEHISQTLTYATCYLREISR